MLDKHAIDPVLGAFSTQHQKQLRDNWVSFSQLFDKGVVPIIAPDNTIFMRGLCRAWLCSRFVLEQCLRHPDLLISLCDSGDLFDNYEQQDFARRYIPSSEALADDGAFRREIRMFRNREMVRLAWRDIALWADIEQILLELSWLAEYCIQISLQQATERLQARFGIPVKQDQSPMQLLVLGMGKLGGWELNFSSDIDLIFAYSDDGKLEDRKETTYQHFFTKVAQQLIANLDQVNEHGFVFRVDTRLRPFGDSGPLVMSLDAMENYYQRQAREWERYAMIKCRPIAGDALLGKEVTQMLRPFIYRSYLDYGALDDLRDLKAQINQQNIRRNKGDSIKLGPGGIREVEFIGQVFQLIHGGRELSLRGTRLVPLLRCLGGQGALENGQVERLIQSYRQLRRVENRLQQYADQQTHVLPHDEERKHLLAVSLHYPSWEVLELELRGIRSYVHRMFEQVFALEDSEKIGPSQWAWLTEDWDERPLMLADMGMPRAEEAARHLESFRNCAAVRRLSKRSRGRLDRLMPKLLEAVLSSNEPVSVLQRMLSVLEAIVGRGVYLSLLLENFAVRIQLIRLVEASPWIAQMLSHCPMLLDELLDPRTLYQPLRKDQLDAQIRQEFAVISTDDLERQMDMLRRFRQVQMLHVAAADIAEAIPIMVVSDYLTEIAEVTLQQALRIAWIHTGKRYGFPVGYEETVVRDFAVIAYGKLGGKELGYGSDLDLVFIHTAASEAFTADECEHYIHFHTRLAQKLVTLMNTRMLTGIAYEIDTRLRPSGQSGLLVTSVAAYRDYLFKQAWLWEHQALVKARYVAGDGELGREFSRVRKEVLVQQRDPIKLRSEVRDMRQKMRESLSKGNMACFDLKQDAGGIADIEFIVQFEILLHAHEMPELVGSTDVVRLLARLEASELLTSSTVDVLRQAYCVYRAYGHKSALQDQPIVVDDDRFLDHQMRVQKIWQALMEKK